jgi:hypothetical protein
MRGERLTSLFGQMPVVVKSKKRTRRLTLTPQGRNCGTFPDLELEVGEFLDGVISVLEFAWPLATLHSIQLQRAEESPLHTHTDGAHGKGCKPEFSTLQSKNDIELACPNLAESSRTIRPAPSIILGQPVRLLRRSASKPPSPVLSGVV